MTGTSQTPAGKRPARQLPRNDNFHFSILAATPHVITLTDLQGKIIYASPKVVEMFGFHSAEATAGLSFLEYLDPADRDKAARTIATMSCEESGTVQEYRGRKADGSTFDLEINYEFVRDESGVPTNILLITRDVSARKEREAAMRRNAENLAKQAELQRDESEQKYKALFYDSPDGHLILKDGVFIECNRAAGELLHGDPALIIGKSPIEISPEYQPNGRKSAEYAAETLAKVQKMGKGHCEWVHSCFDGTESMVRINLTMINYEGQAAILATWQDISELKRIEKWLSRKERMLQAIAKSTEELLSNSDIFMAINHSLPLIGEAAEVDRCYLFQNDYDENNEMVTSQRLEWNSGAAEPQIDNPELQNTPIAAMGSLLDELKARRPFMGIVSQLEEGSDAREILTAQEIKSILLIPIFFKDFFWGFVGYDECHFERVWAMDEVSILRSFSNSISSALARAHAEEILKNSESRLSTLIRNLKEGVLLEDHHRKIVLTNQKFCDMFNVPLPPEMMTGADCSASAEESKHHFINPEQFVLRIDQILAEKKAVLSEELELVNGLVYERDYIPIFINDSYRGHLWKYQDITERKNHLRTLRLQEEKYRNIIVNMNLGLIETNESGIIQYANQRVVEMSGFTLDELLGKKAVDFLIAPDYRPTVAEHDSFHTSGGSDLYEVQVQTKSGECRWWLASGAPIYNDEGYFVGVVGIYLDLTDQKRLEEDLKIARTKAEESSRAKDTFLANMSHEIRTPLNAIIGMVREFSRETLSPRQSLYIKNAGTASQHLLSIVNDILDISKIEAGQLQLDQRSFSLREVIEDTIAIELPSASDKMLALRAEISSQVAAAYLGDPIRIRQILINIINNAIKFTEHGSVVVRCEVADEQSTSQTLLITVTDTGIGMEPAFISKIFDKFSQEDTTASRKVGGTGLGMRITRELLQKMNGQITIDSEKGRGTTVSIRIELEFINKSDQPQTASSIRYQKLKNKRLLLVEDNDMNRLVATSSLSYFDLQITEAVNGLDAIDKLKQQSFDIILMDLHMPFMSGLEATRIIRGEMGLTTPIIALTADAFKSEIDRCMEAGMNDYITKPFEEEVLFGAILRNLGSGAAPVGAVVDLPDAPAPERETERGAAATLYSLEQLMKFSRGNLTDVRQMVELFIQQTPLSLAELRKALESHDLEAVHNTAHRIKPTIDLLAMTDPAGEVRQVETLARIGGGWTELEEAIARLESQLSSAIAQLIQDPVLR